MANLVSEWYHLYYHIVVKDHEQQLVSCNRCKNLLFVTSASGRDDLKSHFNSCTQQTDKSKRGHQQTVHQGCAHKRHREVRTLPLLKSQGFQL